MGQHYHVPFLVGCFGQVPRRIYQVWSRPRRPLDFFATFGHFAREASRGGAFPNPIVERAQIYPQHLTWRRGNMGRLRWVWLSVRSEWRATEPLRRASPVSFIFTGWRFTAFWITPAIACIVRRGIGRLRTIISGPPGEHSEEHSDVEDPPALSEDIDRFSGCISWDFRDYLKGLR